MKLGAVYNSPAMIKTIILCAIALPLIGCNSVLGEYGYLRDRVDEYKPSYSIAPLKMPPGVKEVPQDPYYTIPDVERNDGPTVVLYPPGSKLMQQAQQKTQSK